MNQPGRNDPCPCGSGRKFKRCHGARTQASASPEEETWRRLRRLLDDHPSTMLRFVRDRYGEGALHEAWEEFVLWDDSDPGFSADTPLLPVFLPWFFHHWAPDPPDTSVEAVALHDRAPTSVFLERRGRRLDALLRRYLEACLRSPFSFHEILRCDPGVGFRARDLFTGEERDVLERSASRTMRVGDAFFGQVVTCDGVTVMEACAPHAVPPRHRLVLIDLREHMAAVSEPSTPEALMDWDLEFRETYLFIHDALVRPPRPVLQNTDGDPLAFHRLHFEIDSPRRAFEALKELAHAEPESELVESAELDAEGGIRRVSFAWTVPGNRQHQGWDNTVLGHIEIDGPRMVADVNSAERAARFRGLVEERLGEEARLVRTEVEDAEDLLEAGAVGEGPFDGRDGPDLAGHPEVRKVLDEHMATHYEAWVSEPIPLLDGRTPLEAVEDQAGREKVRALVDQIERDGQRMEPPLDPAVVRRLRRRLGLEGEG